MERDFYGYDNNHLVIVQWGDAVRNWHTRPDKGLMDIDDFDFEPSTNKSRSKSVSTTNLEVTSSSLLSEISQNRRMIFPHQARILSRALKSVSYTGAKSLSAPTKETVGVPLMRLSAENWFGERLSDVCQPFRLYAWENYKGI